MSTALRPKVSDGLGKSQRFAYLVGANGFFSAPSCRLLPPQRRRTLAPVVGAPLRHQFDRISHLMGSGVGEER